MNDVEKKVIKITAETLKIEENKITLESNFVSDLGTDSLDLVELMMAFEANFDCDIPEEEASKIGTIADVVQYIKSKAIAA